MATRILPSKGEQPVCIGSGARRAALRCAPALEKRARAPWVRHQSLHSHRIEMAALFDAVARPWRVMISTPLAFESVMAYSSSGSFIVGLPGDTEPDAAGSLHL